MLYYNTSRYYDPEIGRWISPDDISYLDPSSINGLNLYCYCKNNPIMMVDSSGYWPNWNGFGKWLGQVGNNISNGLGAAGNAIGNGFNSVVDFYVNTYTSIFNFGYDIGKDLVRIGFNPFNSNEQKVLDSKYISFYKGQLVIRQNFAPSSFSFGAMFLHKDEYDIDVVKHEWGHYVQLLMMGPNLYALSVAIPSVINFYRDNNGWLTQDYYSYPWEWFADLFGGVNRGLNIYVFGIDKFAKWFWNNIAKKNILTL